MWGGRGASRHRTQCAAHLDPVVQGGQLPLLVLLALLQLQHSTSLFRQLLMKGTQKSRVVACCCPEASDVVLRC